jgi:hypothetical protein
MTTLIKAQLYKNEQTTGKVLKNKLSFVALLTQKEAVELGVPWLVFEKGGAIREGFTNIALQAQFIDATLTHDVGKINKLELNGVEVSHFAAKRLGDGKKKPKKVMLVFSAFYDGPPFQLQEHLLKVGRGEGDLIIKAPEQLQITEASASAVAVPDDDGRFPGIKPITAKKFGKAAVAQLFVVESKQGWHWGFQAQLAKAIEVNPLRIENGPSESEAAALHIASRKLADWALGHGRKLRGAEKQTAGLMIEWAEKIGNPQA